MQLNFEWDEKKARSNIEKHKVSFELAATIFKDPRTISLFDEEHSEDEERWISIGMSTNGVVLVVSHAYKRIDKNKILIRLISSRRATKKEEKQYTEE